MVYANLLIFHFAAIPRSSDVCAPLMAGELAGKLPDTAAKIRDRCVSSGDENGMHEV